MENTHIKAEPATVKVGILVVNRKTNRGLCGYVQNSTSRFFYPSKRKFFKRWANMDHVYDELKHYYYDCELVIRIKDGVIK